MKIEINKPCHENWDAMTPTEQGAFCAVCTTNVVDFSTKTIEEIKAFFSSKRRNKICGRFKTSQLEELSFDAFFERFSGFRLKRKVAVVIAATFFTWFLAAGNAFGQTTPHKMGKIKYVPPTDTTKVKNPKDTTAAIKPPKPLYTKGDVMYVPEKPLRKED